MVVDLECPQLSSMSGVVKVNRNADILDSIILLLDVSWLFGTDMAYSDHQS